MITFKTRVNGGVPSVVVMFGNTAIGSGSTEQEALWSAIQTLRRVKEEAQAKLMEYDFFNV